MIARWHLLAGEYPPTHGGIAQFAHVMAEALAERGADVHVWTPGESGPGGVSRVVVHQLPDRFGRGSIAALAAATRDLPGRVLLHYTPNALGARGANLPFCRWYAAQGRRAWDARVLFHEPFMYFGRQSLARNALAVVHRLMATALLTANEEVLLSTPAWEQLLAPYSASSRRWTWIPISAGSPPLASADAVVAARARLGRGARWLLGTFGTYARETAGVLRDALAAALDACPDAHIACFGRNSDAFVASFSSSGRVSSAGELTDEELGAAIGACDLMLQPFPEGVTVRRTSLLRSLAAGAPVVTTSGRFTEPIWDRTGAVSLVPAGAAEAFGRAVARLLTDDAARARLGAAARATYDSTFSPGALVNALDPAGSDENVLVGTHTYAASGDAAVRQQAALQSLAALRHARSVSLEHEGCGMTPRVRGIEYLSVLREDSVAAARVSGARKAIVSEVFRNLANRAVEMGSRYFLFANGDVQLSQEVVDRVRRGGRLAYAFWRTDRDSDQSNVSLMADGIDVFAVDARWYTANAWRFRPYILGESTWDNVYAAILGVEAAAAFVAEPGWVLHERHELKWGNSPFQPYVRYLSALDHRYFSLWCRFWDRSRGAVARGATAELDVIAAEVFRQTPPYRVRAIQLGRDVKAVARYYLTRT